MKTWAKVLACGLLVVSILAEKASADPSIHPDVVYGHKDGMALTFDLIRPENPSGAAILWMQSGGWYSNWMDPKLMMAFSKPFLDKGYTMIIVRHGSAPKYTVPEAVDDVRRAVRVIHLKAKDLKVDADRLGVLGGSAGGHLSLMLATTGDDGDANSKDEVLKQSSRVAAVVALYPPTDISTWTTNPPDAIAKVPALKPPLTFDAKKAAEVSPLLKATEKTVPSLMIHGDKDELVTIDHSQKMLAALEKLKVPSKLVTIEGAAHSFSQQQNEKIVLPEMMAWFDKYLAKKAE